MHKKSRTLTVFLFLLPIIVTSAALTLTVDHSKYVFCLKKECIDYFFSEFKVFTSIILAEFTFLSIIIAVAKLKTAEESLKESIASNRAAERSAQFQIFSQMINEEIKSHDNLKNLKIHEFALFSSMIYYTEESKETKPGNIKNLVCFIKDEESSYTKNPLSWNRSHHLHSLKEKTKSVGIILPDLDEDADIYNEILILETIRNLCFFMEKVGQKTTIKSSEVTTRPNYIPAEIQT